MMLVFDKKKLRRLMDEKGFNQTSLAKESRLTQGAINQYLKGGYLPKLNSLISLSLALDVNVRDLLKEVKNDTII